MIAYCGLDCSKCIAYLATQANDQKQISEVARKWSAQFMSDVKPEHVICDGCKAGGRKSIYCGNLCKVRKCCAGKRYGTCIECADFACSDLNFILSHAPEARSNLDKLRK
ncbi:MAG: DUF3795 domain-containing protein [Candidatus Omnitrophota bacterium]